MKIITKPFKIKRLCNWGFHWDGSSVIYADFHPNWAHLKKKSPKIDVRTRLIAGDNANTVPNYHITYQTMYIMLIFWAHPFPSCINSFDDTIYILTLADHLAWNKQMLHYKCNQTNFKVTHSSIESKE